MDGWRHRPAGLSEARKADGPHPKLIFRNCSESSEHPEEDRRDICGGRERPLALVFPFPACAYSFFREFWPEFFEELHEATDQFTASANHMQAAFMLMLFQNLVQAIF